MQRHSPYIMLFVVAAILACVAVPQQMVYGADAPKPLRSTSSELYPGTQVVLEASICIQNALGSMFATAQAVIEDKVSESEEADRLCAKTLPYDPALIAQVGTQEGTGHSICCPSFSCAYADAVLTGEAIDHAYYGCGNCIWTDWGGGDSSFRSLGSSEALLKEAYDQIMSGTPTVIHVAASWGEHWIVLIGYRNAIDPEHLGLENFIALDPWDGAERIAGDRYVLYGDDCQHISSR